MVVMRLGRRQLGRMRPKRPGEACVGLWVNYALFARGRRCGRVRVARGRTGVARHGYGEDTTFI
jgi:hypothetical protein